MGRGFFALVSGPCQVLICAEEEPSRVGRTSLLVRGREWRKGEDDRVPSVQGIQ